MTARRPARGFTLVEAAVALAATAVLLGALAVAVPTTLRAQAAVTARLERATATRAVLLHLERELASAVDEPFVVASTPAARLEFTGGAEPGARIAYAVEGGALVRRTSPRFAPAAPPATGVPLVRDVAGLTVSAFDGREWTPRWGASDPPLAVRIALDFADGERAETVALVPVARPRSR